MTGLWLSSPLLFTLLGQVPGAPNASPASNPNPPAVQDSGAPESSAPAEPFAWGDFSWLNGGSRQSKRLLSTPYFTGQVDVDVNYTYSFAHPKDDTVVGSTALARNNEVELSFLGFGGDFRMDNVRGRVLLQLGTRSTVVPRNDTSTLRGQFDLATAYRYISEGYAGYHWDVLNGINLDVGIFMSYVGLFSYDNWENWAYQPSFTSDNTPWFFNGARLQIFPSDRLKVEFWLINGWQTYAKFNSLPGVGAQALWRPQEWISLVTNNYVGTDTQDHPGRVRFHTDDSVLVRYYNNPGGGVTRGAISATFDLGFEGGGGVTPFGGSGGPPQNFISGMLYHRLWFLDNHLGWTVGGGIIHNPGRYLVLAPPGAAGQDFPISPGTQFDGWDASTTFDWMPADWSTFRIELVHRQASVPYFAGPGGVTSPDGYSNTAIPPGWSPDQVKQETRLVAALICRF